MLHNVKACVHIRDEFKRQRRDQREVKEKFGDNSAFFTYAFNPLGRR